MKKQKLSRKILAITLSAALVLGMLPITAQAAMPAPTAGDVSDGVDFDAVSKPGNGIYYGTYKHVTKVAYGTSGLPTEWEDSPTPILWEVMGEESNDGVITLLSKYVLDSRRFHSTFHFGDNYYNDSDMRISILNSLFLNSFATAERDGMADVNVVTGMYDTDTGTENTGFYTIEEDAYTYPNALPWTTTGDKVYLPWGLGYSDQIYWSAGNDTNEGLLNSQVGTMKSGKKVDWVLRSPFSLASQMVMAATAYGVEGRNIDEWMGVRPAFKLKPSEVVFASKIKASPDEKKGETGTDSNYTVNSIPGAANYKLTIADNASTDTLNGVPTAAQIVTPGSNLTLNELEPSQTGSEYTLSYKIVGDDGLGGREIVAYGETAAADPATLTLASGGLPAGSYDAYVWLQRNNTMNSNEAIAVQHFSLMIPDITAPVLSDGSINRTSHTEASIGFTTDEAGTAYYSAVDKDTTAPTKEAVAAGTSLGPVSGDVTNKPVTLTAGAKDVYVVVKDASNNISNPLKLEAEAYVSPAEALADTINGLGFDTAISGSAITVTGTKTAASKITLTIPSGVTVVWEASLTGAVDDSSGSLIFLNGAGTFELAGGEITNTGTGMALSAIQGRIVISGGTASSSNAVATVNAYHFSPNAPTLTMTGGTVISTSTDVSSSAISVGANTVITGGTITSASGNQVYLNNAVIVYRSDLLSKIASGSLSASIAVDPSKTFARPGETEGLTATGYTGTTGNVTAYWAVLYPGEGTGVWIDYRYGGSSGTWRVSYPAVNVVAYKQNLTYDANGGSGSMTGTVVYSGQSYTVSVNGFTKSGFDFTGWNTQADGKGTSYSAGAVLIGSASNDAVTLYAQWKTAGSNPGENPGENPGSGSGGGSSSKGSGSGSALPTPSAAVSGTTVTATVQPSIGSDGKAAASLTIEQMSDALAKAKEAFSNNKLHDIKIKVEGTSGASSVAVTIPAASFKSLASGGFSGLTVSSGLGDLTFGADALKTISDASSGDVKVTASKAAASTLSDAAKQVVGDRPVYEFSVTSGGKTISAFGGNVTVSVPYTLAPGEDPDAVVIYYIAADGTLAMVSNARYQAADGRVVFTTDHFSTYAVGYNKVSFSDVAEGAWYCKAVTYLAAREVTSGTTATTFGSNEMLTRGQFITLLLKAYCVEPDANSRDNFSDAGSTYYTGYLASAKALGISDGIGNNQFAPDKAVTRQEMFTMLGNALKSMNQQPEGSTGKTLSDFSDAQAIAPWAKEAMTMLVETGTVNGSNGKLSPASTTTRAEMAQVLYQLLEN